MINTNVEKMSKLPSLLQTEMRAVYVSLHGDNDQNITAMEDRVFDATYRTCSVDENKVVITFAPDNLRGTCLAFELSRKQGDVHLRLGVITRKEAVTLNIASELHESKKFSADIRGYIKENTQAYWHMVKLQTCYQNISD